MNLQWPDVRLDMGEMRQCVQCGEFKAANHMYRDLDHDGDFYCGKCAFWSAIPEQGNGKVSPDAEKHVSQAECAVLMPSIR